MSVQQNLFGLVDPGREIRRPPLIGVKFLHQGAVRATDVLGARPRLKAQDLVGLLFGHRTRLRVDARPRVSIRMSVFTPAGKPAVKIRF